MAKHKTREEVRIEKREVFVVVGSNESFGTTSAIGETQYATLAKAKKMASAAEIELRRRRLALSLFVSAVEKFVRTERASPEVAQELLNSAYYAHRRTDWKKRLRQG